MNKSINILDKDYVEKKAESRWGSGFMKNFYRLYQPYMEFTPQVGEQMTQQAVEQSGEAIAPQLVEQIKCDIFSIGWGRG